MSSGFNIVVLGSYGPSLVNFRGSLIAAMVERGWKVTAVAPGIDAAVAESLHRLGAEVVNITLARTGMNPISDLMYYFQLGNIFKEQNPDVVLAYTAKPVIWGALAAKWLGVSKIVVMITGLGFAYTEGAGTPLMRRVARVAASMLYRRAFRVCDKVLFQNPDDRDLFVQHGLLMDRGQISLTDGSGVDLSYFTPSPPPAAPIFLMIARLLGAKGVREYAAAAIALKSRWPKASFRLVGWIDPGPDSISKNELDGWTLRGLEFVGRLDDVRPAIAQASVYVLPSWREGTPRSVLEAMAMARAIVTTDAPGCRETVVDGDNGFLVPPRDVKALISAMERFILEPGLAARMGRASHARACQKYDVRKVNANILEVIESA